MSVLQRPLFSLVRNGFEEVRICGEIAVHDGTKTLFETGEAGCYPARSLLKPFQFEAAAPKSGWSEQLRFTPCLGSVSATREQVAQLESWYSGSPSRRFFKLPPSYPMDETNRVLLKLDKKNPEQIFHTCFSKHAAIVECCDREGWPAESYLSLEHPYHRRLVGNLEKYLAPRTSCLAFVTDGCLLPSPVLKLNEMARLYATLASSAEGTTLAEIRRAMLKTPEWVGGPGRIDTKMMVANAGRLVAKEGADGLWGIAVLPTTEFPKGLGITLKLSSGYQPIFAAISLGRMLEWAGLNTIHEAPKGQDVVYHYQVLGMDRR